MQLDFNNDSFRVVHGTHGSNFPSDAFNNVFVGISKDISCASDGEDISMCEGEDYIQLRFHDNHFGKYENHSGFFCHIPKSTRFK